MIEQAGNQENGIAEREELSQNDVNTATAAITTAAHDPITPAPECGIVYAISSL
jgi:hypothetical protein